MELFHAKAVSNVMWKASADALNVLKCITSNASDVSASDCP